MGVKLKSFYSSAVRRRKYFVQIYDISENSSNFSSNDPTYLVFQLPFVNIDGHWRDS